MGQSSSIASPADERGVERALLSRPLQVRSDDAGAGAPDCTCRLPTMEYNNRASRACAAQLVQLYARAVRREPPQEQAPSTLTHGSGHGRRAAGSCRSGSSPQGASAFASRATRHAPRGERDERWPPGSESSDAMHVLTLTSPSGGRVGARPAACRTGGYRGERLSLSQKVSGSCSAIQRHLAQRRMMLREHERVPPFSRASGAVENRAHGSCRRFSSRDIPRGAARWSRAAQVGCVRQRPRFAKSFTPHTTVPRRSRQVPSSPRGGPDGQHGRAAASRHEAPATGRHR